MQKIEHFEFDGIKYCVIKHEDHFGFQSWAEIYYKPWDCWIGRVYNYGRFDLIKRNKLMLEYIKNGNIKRENCCK